jgi:hypothetical protein
VHVLGFAPNVSLVNLYFTIQGIFILGQGLPDLVEHAPTGLDRNSQAPA